VFTVTDLTKVIAGVRTVVAWDQDYSDGELVEAELAFFAQDNDGTVWSFGQYPEEYEDGEIVGTPAWIHGVEGARAGITMLASPQLEKPSYSQGWGPAVDYTDRGQVYQMDQQACVPLDCYEDVLVITETSKAEPGAQQLKYYARGVGNVLVDWQGEDQTQEKLELIEVVQLAPDALDEVRAQALALEKSAYEISKDVYAHTSPAEYSGSALASTAGAAPLQVDKPQGASSEIVVYASNLPRQALSEFDFLDDPASPGGKLVGTPNTGDELDPPPENDPHVIFNVQVQGSIPYRCWIHMKVGAPKGKSQANMFWVQFSDAVDQANREILKPGTASYLTAQGPTQEGWAWVGCNLAAAASSQPLIYFRTSGEITVRVQAGMEGTGFDQFLLSPARYLEEPPTETIVGE
jgi:hypothetical protein